MNTYFTQSNIMKRFFFVVGKTKDTFVDEALSAYDLEFYDACPAYKNQFS